MKSKSVFAAVVALAAIVSASSFARDNVSGYYRKDGTYVQGYTRSSPDQYRSNNLSSQSYGGSKRDEYSSGTGATNKSNSSYGWRDNDSDGVFNPYDRSPDSKQR